MNTPVNNVNGIGPKTAEYLKNKKVTTVAGLLKFGVTKLALAPGFNPGRATTVINEAKKMVGGSKPLTSKPIEKIKAKKEKSDKKNKKNKKNKDKKNTKKKKEKKEKKKDKNKNKK
jgi:hypothetical protein